MKLNNKARGAALALALLLAVPVPAHASDYDFESEDGTDYYTPTEYEDVYGAQYNYSGQNVSDFQTVELPYGVYSNTATGAMEKVRLPGQAAAYGSLAIDYGGIPEILNVNPTAAATSPQQAQPVYQKPAYTSAADMTRKDGSIGTIQIPTLGIDMKVWEGETNESMKKGIAHYTVMRTMVSQAVRTAGIAIGKTCTAGGKGAGANANGGKPQFGKSAAGASQRGAGAKGAKTAQQKSTSQTGTAKTGQAWQPAGRPITITPDDREDAALNGTPPMSGASAAQGQSAGGEKGAERKTSVPPGTTRSPSVVKNGGSVVKHTAASSTRSTAAQESRKSHTESAKAPGVAAASHPGTAGKGASVPKSNTGMRTGVRPGTAGTAHGAAERPTQGKSAGVQPGTAGTAAVTRITNAPRTTQVQTTRSSAESSQQLQAGAEKAPGMAGNGVVKPVASRQGKSAANAPRFTQRPASASGGVSSAAPAKTGGAEQAKGSAAPSGVAVKAGTARQETRTAHPAGTKAERPHKQPISATARQESRLRTQNGRTEKSAKPVLRHGTAGSAPVPARTSQKDKHERAPRQEKADDAEAKTTDKRKEDADDGRTRE